jgi:tRNA threonylcarbamoyladenosine biosynthesis protein TsaB
MTPVAWHIVRILALETTEAIASVAALDDAKLLSELRLDGKQRSAQSLAPALKTLLEQVRWKPGDVELVAVSIGPGSFTGLRIGVTTAKTFAYAAKAGILGISTLEAIAAAAPADVESLRVVIDAQRGDVVAGSFRRGDDGSFQPLDEPQLVQAEAWLHGLPRGTVVSGPVLGKLAGRIPPGIRVLGPECGTPTAAAIGRLAARHHAAGRRDDLWTLAPRYSRRSAAEEKREASDKGLRG